MKTAKHQIRLHLEKENNSSPSIETNNSLELTNVSSPNLVKSTSYKQPPKSTTNKRRMSNLKDSIKEETSIELILNSPSKSVRFMKNFRLIPDFKLTKNRSSYLNEIARNTSQNNTINKTENIEYIQPDPFVIERRKRIALIERMKLKKIDNKQFFKKIYISDKLNEKIKRLTNSGDSNYISTNFEKEYCDLLQMKAKVCNLNHTDKYEFYKQLFSKNGLFSKGKNKNFNNGIFDYDSYISPRLKEYLYTIPESLINKNSGSVVDYFAINTIKGPYKLNNDDAISVILDVEKPPGFKGIWPKVSYFAIFNGHKGNTTVSFVKENMHKFLFNQKYFPYFPYMAINMAFKELQTELKKMYYNETKNITSSTTESNENVFNCGSTALVLVIIDDTAYVANCGASRMILSQNSMDKIYDITLDHNPHNLLERDRITLYGGKVYSENHISNFDKIDKISPGDMIITRSLGDIKIKEDFPNIILSQPEISSFYINSKDDFLFLGSDGIFSVLDSKEFSLFILSQLMNKIEELQSENIDNKTNINITEFYKELNDNLLKMSLITGAYDNVSGILICFENFKSFTKNTLDYYQNIFKYLNDNGSIFKLKSQEIKTYNPSSQIVFLRKFGES